MNQIRMLAGVCVLATALAAVGQDAPISPAPGAGTTGQSATSTPQAPAVQETGGQGEQGLLGGDKPFTLMVDPDVGELNYIFGLNKDLESIQAKRGVVFSSEDMTLNSDQFEYKPLNSQLVATGKRVVVRLGDIIVTCQLFKYNPDTQEGEFQGNPVVYSKDKDGNTRQTAGHIISVFNVNGKTQMRIKSSPGGAAPYVRSGGQEAPVPAENTKQQPGQRNATITLDENQGGSGNTSPVVTPASSGAPAGGAQSGNLLGIPGSTGATGQTKKATAPKSNRIDPNNPNDVRSLSTTETPGPNR